MHGWKFKRRDILKRITKNEENIVKTSLTDLIVESVKIEAQVCLKNISQLLSTTRYIFILKWAPSSCETEEAG